MVTLTDANGDVVELRCDVCGIEYDSVEELDEFVRFNFTMGPKSQYPDKVVRFDCCQDCFIDAFPLIFNEEVETNEQDDHDIE